MGKEQEVARLWAQAKATEQGGDPPRIRQAYEDIISADPHQVGAWLKLSQLSFFAGDYRSALDLALQAADATTAGQRWRALPYAGQQLLRFDERGRVSALIRGADWRSPEVLAQAAVLSQQLWLADDHEGALAFLDHVITLLPSHHLLHFCRGEALNHLGRMEECKADYERSIQLKPSFAQAHLALACNAPTAEPGARVPRLKASLAAAIDVGTQEDQISLQYALFRELDAAGMMDDAWRHLEAGSAQRHRMGRHDAQVEMEGVDELINSCGLTVSSKSVPPVGHRRGHIFVVGMPRTGTTVLDRMLSNHPEVGSAGELNTFARSVSWEANRFLEPPLHPALIKQVAHLDWHAIGMRYAEATRHLHADKPHLLDKNPLNIHNAGFIARALPQARILCLMRNPMDACFSSLKELFAPGTYGYSYDLHALATHYAGFLRLVAHWQRTLPGRFRMVRYETLVDSPEEVLADAMDFCDLDFDPIHADITRNTEPVSTASRAQVRQPLNRRGIGAWRRYERQLQPLRRRLEELGVDVEDQDRPD